MSLERPLIIQLSQRDNVAVALQSLPAGTTLPVEGLTCKALIPSGHKVAIRSIDVGSPVYKFGQIIGFASAVITPGEHVHTHNLEIQSFAREYAIGADIRPVDFFRPEEQRTFGGIVRADGSVGTRNYVGVLATVSCAASVTRFIADAFKEVLLEDYPNVDGVVAITHGSGCALPLGGEAHRMLQRTLAGFARHPNFAGVLLVGLGCEVNQVETLMMDTGLGTGSNLRTLVIQQTGGTRRSVESGVSAVREMLSFANQVERQPVPASHLVVGLECGGSDAFSGITANPALGVAVDLVIRNGGTAILSETPEIYGAEHLLTRRAVNQDVGHKLIKRIRWWEEYTAREGAEIDNNPSPGNKAGGLTTIHEKALGAVAKGGSTNLVEVYRYAEPVGAKGLVFMDTPGYDAVSITGMVAGGANVLCFTTGRGSVYGCKPVPSIKLATNSLMYHRLSEDMDVNCGSILDGEATIEQMGSVIFELMLETASGRKTKSELLGFGDHEFVPWYIGAVL
jgi:altronate hydrolase